MPKPYFEEDGIQIFHGDCCELLPTVLSCQADLILTDPPYDIQDGGNWFAKVRVTYRKIGESLSKGCNYDILAYAKRWIVFCNKDQLPLLLPLAWKRSTWAILTWIKTNPSPLTHHNYLPDTEYMIHSYPAGELYGEYADRFKWYASSVNGWDRASNHPTEKPIGLISKLVRLGSLPNEVVLDPYMGSGTTLVAAKLLGRKAIGIDTEEWCCEVGADRLRQGVFLFNDIPISQQIAFNE